MKRLLLLIFILQVLSADKLYADETVTIDQPPVADPAVTNYELLFIGNSHSSANGLPKLVKKLIENGLPGTSVNTKLASGWRYLSERLNDGTTQRTLQSRDWTHVILQAQKYSSSGRYSYPTDAAKEWIRRVRAISAIPVLFPEWPRKGNLEEGKRVNDLHLQIASHEHACVAPIGLAWDEARIRYPDIDLYANDGNHSNLKGALLSAFVLYELITRQPAEDLPHITSIRVTAESQLQLSKIASGVVEKFQFSHAENLCN